ncbi:VanW family protein [Bacillota bacterium LX-D]|nr:VanW family protein [Bacillota bacterium LX-D]
MKNISFLVLLFFLFCACPVHAATQHELSSFSTPLVSKNSNRLTNIRLAARKIDGFILQPNKIFSFNKIVGPRTAGNGYKLADIFSDGKVVKGIGGGICQISSTIYQSALSAKLKIIEVHRHSRSVKYIGRGQDATVSWGTYDLKFQNTKNDPIMLKTYISNSSVTVKVFQLIEDKEEPVNIYINNQVVKGYIINGITYAPCKIFHGYNGLSVAWDEKTQSITVKNQDNVTLKILVGKNLLEKNGISAQLPGGVKYKDRKMMVSIRPILELFKIKPTWQSGEHSLCFK